MSWIHDLYMTYEKNKSEAGVVREGKPMLLPIAHLTQNAQLEVILDEAGNFNRAIRIEKADAVTVIPVTEASGSRSGKAVFPHPLDDKLEYIAGDYGEFVTKDKECQRKYDSYIRQLDAWAQSDYSLPQIRTVCQYLRRGTLMHDLLDAGIFTYENGEIKAEKQQGAEVEDWFARFSVEIPGQVESRLYRDPRVFESYIQYYLSIQEGRELCYVSGEQTSCSEKHPSKIRNTADKAKLISSNEASGFFTFRGRFDDKGQVASVGYEISQKAHSALRWLISKQACLRVGEQVFVVWSIENPLMEDPFDEFFEEEISDSQAQPFTDEAYALQVKNAIWGSKDIADGGSVIVMGVEAATTGRLSIPFYQKYDAKQFLENIVKWKTETCWLNRPGKDMPPVRWSPSLVEIVKLAAGDRNDKANKSMRERLLPCIVEGRRLPYDIVLAAFRQAVNPSHFKEYWEWNRAVTVACALLRKWEIEKGRDKEECSMALNEESMDRSYVFGRLLATAEMLERSALSMGSGKEVMRNTAAEKYFVRFQRYPVETWATIRNQLQPYVMKLKTAKNSAGKYAGKLFYVNQMDELTSRLDFTQKEKLDPSFLQGYSSQIMQYRNYLGALGQEKEEDQEKED